jgi:hypothetical protein
MMNGFKTLCEHYPNPFWDATLRTKPDALLPLAAMIENIKHQLRYVFAIFG